MPTPPAEPRQSGRAPEVATLLGVGELATTAAPPAAATAGVVVAGGVVAKATGNILAALARYARKRARDEGAWIYAALLDEFPDRPKSRIRAVVAEEMRREREFQRKRRERLERDLPEALRDPNPQRRNERVTEILDRERRYDEMREEAMAERARGKMATDYLREASPDFVYWKLSPFVKEHTPECVVLGEKLWPWEVINAVGSPPLHPGCACELLSVDEALSLEYMHPDQKPEAGAAVKRALRDFKRAQELSHALPAAEIADYLTELEEGHVEGERSTVRRLSHRALSSLIPEYPPPTLAERRRRLLERTQPDLDERVQGVAEKHLGRLIEVDFDPSLHPRDAIGRFMPKLGPPTGLFSIDPTDRMGRASMDAALASRGHSQKAMTAADDIMDSWRHGSNSTESAMAKITTALHKDTAVGKVLRDRIGLETAAARRELMAHPRTRLYRQGTRDMMASWTTNPEGAHSLEVTGKSPHFYPDRSEQLSSLLKDFDVLAGYHYSPGYAGEDEIALIDKRIVAGKARVAKLPMRDHGSYGGIAVSDKAAKDTKLFEPDEEQQAALKRARNIRWAIMPIGINGGPYTGAGVLDKWKDPEKVTVADYAAALRSAGLEADEDEINTTLRHMAYDIGDPDDPAETAIKRAGYGGYRMEGKNFVFDPPPWEPREHLKLTHLGDSGGGRRYDDPMQAIVITEADFNARLHPRNRRGQFLDTPNLPGLTLPGSVDDESDGEDDIRARIDSLFGGDPPADHKLIQTHPPISKKVSSAVHDNASATAYMKKLGVDLDMGDFKGDESFWQEIAQATDDASTRFPVLTKGGPDGKLGKVTLFSRTSKAAQEANAEMMGHGWALTSLDLSNRKYEDGRLPTDAPPGAKVNAWITLFDPSPEQARLFKADNPDDGGVVTPEMEPDAEGKMWLDEAFEQGFSVQPTRWVYGRFMHELGHAVSQVAGLDWAGSQYSEKQVDLLSKAGVRPAEVEAFSSYSATSVQETWAEIFCALNSPNGLDDIKPETVTKLKGLQKLANKWAADNDIPGGRVL